MEYPEPNSIEEKLMHKTSALESTNRTKSMQSRLLKVLFACLDIEDELLLAMPIDAGFYMTTDQLKRIKSLSQGASSED